MEFVVRVVPIPHGDHLVISMRPLDLPTSLVGCNPPPLYPSRAVTIHHLGAGLSSSLPANTYRPLYSLTAPQPFSVESARRIIFSIFCLSVRKSSTFLELVPDFFDYSLNFRGPSSPVCPTVSKPRRCCLPLDESPVNKNCNRTGKQLLQFV